MIKDELNVKKIKFIAGKGELRVEFDTNLTQDLKDEGLARDIIRKIQEERKKLDTALDKKVDVFMPDWPKDWEEYIKKKALVSAIQKRDQFSVAINE